MTEPALPVDSSRMSLRAFARARGVTVQAVREVIARGHLPTSVGRDERTGHPYIKDFVVAMSEWEVNVGPSTAEYVGVRALPGEGKVSARQPDGRTPPARTRMSAMARAALRQKEVAARLAELDLAKKSGVLVASREADLKVARAYTSVRTRVMAVPSRFRQLWPDFDRAALDDLDSLLREALEELGRDATEPTNGAGPSAIHE